MKKLPIILIIFAIIYMAIPPVTQAFFCCCRNRNKVTPKVLPYEIVIQALDFSDYTPKEIVDDILFLDSFVQKSLHDRETIIRALNKIGTKINDREAPQDDKRELSALGRTILTQNTVVLNYLLATETIDIEAPCDFLGQDAFDLALIAKSKNNEILITLLGYAVTHLTGDVLKNAYAIARKLNINLPPQPHLALDQEQKPAATLSLVIESF